MYAVTESIAEDSKWKALLNDTIRYADHVEFNTLFDSRNLIPELESLSADLVEEGKRKNKIYSSGMFRRYKLTVRLKAFVMSKHYHSWMNYQYEDLSLLRNGVEILATITHENYVYVNMTEEQRIKYNEQGYEFSKLFNIG